MAHSSDARAGLFYGIGAYTLWGLLPLYLHLLTAVPPAQVLANRILWSLLLLLAIVAATRRLRPLVAAARGRVLAMLVASAALIGINWFVTPTGAAGENDTIERIADDLRLRHPIVTAG